MLRTRGATRHYHRRSHQAACGRGVGAAPGGQPLAPRPRGSVSGCVPGTETALLLDGMRGGCSISQYPFLLASPGSVS